MEDGYRGNDEKTRRSRQDVRGGGATGESSVKYQKDAFTHHSINQYNFFSGTIWGKVHMSMPVKLTSNLELFLTLTPT